MSKKLINILLIAGGSLLIIISLSADIIGIGGDLNAFGWKQITGIGVGLLTLLVGIRLWLNEKREK